ncbi:MAG: aminotransferase class IV [Frankiaceae bacterium]|nr:aminotransferase class IV [Frankiaceae bacterium]
MANTVLAVLTPDGPELRDATAPVLRADDLGVLRGESVFETARVAAGKPAFLEAHVTRLGRSAERLAIALPNGWEELSALAVSAYAGSDGVLRLVCSKGPPNGTPVGFALVTEVPPETVRGREHGVRAITLTLGVAAGIRAQSPWLLGGVKATSYAVNMASLRHAQAEGADDVVWLSIDGEVLEAPTSTVAWVTGGRLITPPAEEVSILPGTTLHEVLRLCDQRGVAYEQRRGTADELATADEVLMMSSVRGIAPVTELDGRSLGVGPVTEKLRDAFERLLASG